MFEKLYSLLILILLIVVSIILSNFLDWSAAIFVAVAIVAAIPPFLNKFYFWPKNLKNLPDVDAMPDEILNSKGVTSWEIDFCNDMNEKLKNEEFIKNISRKQCRKLVEIYLERVRKIPEGQIDISKAEIYIGDRKIQ
jgi:hypothetical protein|tara:strand:+ start:230 stop:643 length:414 start_codon:yes stop_codon:yes gene_type:complete